MFVCSSQQTICSINTEKLDEIRQKLDTKKLKVFFTDIKIEATK